jgi:hypothetical protein
MMGEYFRLQVDRQLLGVHPGKTMHLLKGRHEGLTCEVGQAVLPCGFQPPPAEWGTWSHLVLQGKGKQVQLFRQ